MMVFAYYLWLKKYFKFRNFYMTKYIINPHMHNLGPRGSTHYIFGD